MAPVVEPKWWKSASIYQIYPASYCDSNGDGIGDLPGILSKLEYVKSIGIDAIWISPFYDSPNADQGYDISDYQKPLAHYGKVSDVEAIIKKSHQLGMKVLFDLVINHTSDEHHWFQESRKSKDNPYRKFYIWRPPRYNDAGERMPPNNWLAIFGGSAWEYDDLTDEYYLHLFVKKQPDLNWEDEEVRNAIYKEAVDFWLEKGIDGMRIDVPLMYSKTDYEDAKITRPGQFLQPAMEKYVDGKRLIEFLKELHEKTFSKYDAVTIGESPGVRPFELLQRYVSAGEKMFSMAITFDLQALDHNGHGFYKCYRPWKLADFKRITEEAQRLADPKADTWACNYLENHDQARSVSRFMSDKPEHRVISAKTLAIFLLAQSGTPLIYEGEEIGMVNFSPDWPLKEYDDPASRMHMEDVKMSIDAGNKEVTEEIAMDGLRRLARDHARTPMQWSGEKGAGFTTSEAANKTWMRIMDNYTEINAAQQERDPASVLNFYRKMLAFRKEHSASLIFGTFETLDKDNEKTFTFAKKGDGETLVVVLNFSGEKQKIAVSGQKELLLSSTGEEQKDDEELEAYEGRIYQIA